MQIPWSYPIDKIGIGVYEYIFIWRASIARIPHSRHLVLSNSMVQPMKLRCVFNKVFLVNH